MQRDLELHRDNIFIRPLIHDGKLLFSGIVDCYMFSFFVLPSYFGIRVVFFDLTAKRFFLALCLIGIFNNEIRRKEMIGLMQLRKDMIPFVLFQVIAFTTNLLRRSFSSIFAVFIDSYLAFYVLWYIVQYEYGIERTLKKIHIYAWILGLMGIFEGITKLNLFNYLDLLDKGAGTAERFGLARISGPMTTSNGYGLYLLILIPIACYSIDKKEIDILKNKCLFLVLCLNVLFNGTRLTFGLMFLEIFLLIFFTKKDKVGRLLLIFGIVILLGALFMLLFSDSSITQTIMKSFIQVVDTILGTNIGEAYGIDNENLYNSTYYRTLLPRILTLDYLNPILGRGDSYNFSYVMEGYWIQSIDNAYINFYVKYAYPGLIMFIVMVSVFLIKQFCLGFLYHDRLAIDILIVSVTYFIGLWYLDTLHTLPYLYFIMALIQVVQHESRCNMDVIVT